MASERIVDVFDEERGCGRRKAGGLYAVNADNAADGGAADSGAADGGGGGYIGVDEAASGLILFQTPVPLDLTGLNRRSFSYVDGEAILAGSQEAMAAPGITADLAEARALSWKVFGIDYPDRVRTGICAGAESIGAAIDRISSLTWRDRTGYVRAAREVYARVQELRAACGDVQTLGVLVAARQALDAGRRDDVRGYGLTGAGAALAACWRLVDAARRAGQTEIVQQTVRMIGATGATADMPAALIYRPPAHAVCPDVLDYVGKAHYPLARDFVDEANWPKADGAPMGVSRRMHGKPRAVVTPYTRSFLAHARCEFPDGTIGPGIFGYYHVAQTQYVVGADRIVPPDVIAAGAQPVRVRRMKREQQRLAPVPA